MKRMPPEILILYKLFAKIREFDGACPFIGTSSFSVCNVIKLDRDRNYRRVMENLHFP
jgi:hypothetical protein